MRKIKGFTLVEILVVVAVVGLLSSVVLVSVKNVKDRGEITKKIESAATFNHVLGAHLVSEWRFDEGSGNMTYDSSGKYSCVLQNFHAGWLNNLALIIPGGATGWAQNCISNDTKYCLEINNAPPTSGCLSGLITSGPLGELGGGDVAVTAWVKIFENFDGGSIFTYYPSFFFAREASALSVSPIIIIIPGGYNFFISSNKRASLSLGYCPPEGCPASDAVVNVGEWHFIGMVYNNATHKVTFYIDGNKDAEIDYNPSTSWHPLALARISIGKGMNGYLDEIRIYNGVLPSAEIENLYADGLSRR